MENIDESKEISHMIVHSSIYGTKGHLLFINTILFNGYIMMMREFQYQYITEQHTE